MKNLQQLTTDERFILLAAISSGAILELADTSLFTFDKEEADSNPDLIPLDKAQTIKFEILIFDEDNPSKPFKSLSSGSNYTMEQIDGNKDKNLKYVFRDTQSLYQSVALFEQVAKLFNNK